MAYVGRTPSFGEAIILKNIESGFNGSTDTFDLYRTVNGVDQEFHAVSSEHLLVSLGGIIQEPDRTGNTGFNINGNQIVFAVAPQANVNCFIISYGNISDIGIPGIGSVTPDRLSNGGPYWSTTGRVGIGTDSPAYLAHIHNPSTGTGDHAYLHFTTGDTGSTGSDGLTVGIGANQTAYINYREEGPLSLATSGTEKLHITSGGNVGIGTNNPDTLLNLFGTGNATIKVHNNSATSGTYSRLQLITGGTGSSAKSEIRSSRRSSASAATDLGFFTTTSGDTSPTERLLITADGKVGIGTDNPANTLEISKESNHGITLSRPAGGVNPGNFKLEVSSFGAGVITADNNLTLTTGSSQQLIVNRGASESFRVDTSSRVLVGTNTTSSNNLIVVAGTTNGNPGFIHLQSKSTTPGSTDQIGGFNFGTANDVSQARIIAYRDSGTWTPGSSTPTALAFLTNPDGNAGATERLRITAAGDVVIKNPTAGGRYLKGTDTNGDEKILIGYETGSIIRIAESLRMDFSASALEPISDNATDLGQADKRWRNIYSADLQLSNEGSANDVDGTWGNYTIQEGEDDLFLINRRNGKKYKFNLTEVA